MALRKARRRGIQRIGIPVSAPVAYVNNASVIDAFTDPVLVVPTGVAAAHTCIAIVTVQNRAAVFTTPTGWTAGGTRVATGALQFTSALFYRSGLSAGQSVTFVTSDTTSNRGIAFLAFSGGDGTLDGVASSAETVWGTTHTAPNITPVNAGTLPVTICVDPGASSFTVPAGWTERLDTGNVNFNNGAVAATRDTATTAANQVVTGPVVTAGSASDYSLMWTIGIKKTGGVGGGTPGATRVLDLAAWLYDPIPANPVLDSQSAAISAALAGGSHIANMVDFGTTMVRTGVTAATPRYDVQFEYVPEWGSDPFGTETMPIPAGTVVPPGTDGHVSIVDPTTQQIYSLWAANFNGTVKTAGFGAKVALYGDGREITGSSTGANLCRYAGVVGEDELIAGNINHALFFSTDMARLTTFRYPAVKTDGSNLVGSSVTIEEGARVQLNPAVNVDAIPGITAGERTVAKALQTYGAYCGDNGGGRMAFIFEYTAATIQQTRYPSVGLAWDYFDMSHIPWNQLRVLNSWNGT
jgi:hypothetical protein